MAQAADLSRSPGAAEDVAGTLVEVEIDGPVPAGALDNLADLPCVSMAVGASSARSDLAAFDIVLVEGDLPGGCDAQRAAVQAAVSEHPAACLVAVQVLRATARLGVTDALAVESLAYATLQSGPDHRAWLDRRRMPAASSAPDGRRHPPSFVRVEWAGTQLDIVLDDPASRNAFSTGMRDGLVEALRVAASASEATVVLRGEGPAFCSGGDLREFGTTPDPVAAHVVRSTRAAAWWAAKVGPRMRAEVHGACVGAGLELSAWAADVVAAHDTVWFLPEVGMGLIPGAGGTVSIPRRIGRQRTALLALSGMRVDATTGVAWRLADRLKSAVG